MSQDTVVEEAIPVPPPSPRQVALGMFILFQLAFLILSNVVGSTRWAGYLKDEPKRLVNRLAPQFADEKGHVWSWNDAIDADMRRWMHLTGQDQDWTLFSPTVGKATGFPVVLLLWVDPPAQGPSIAGSKLEFNAKEGFNLLTPWDAPGKNVNANVNAVWLPSENAPLDANDFFRFGKMRVRKYEGEFYQNLLPNADESREKAAGRMTDMMRDLIRDSHDFARGYLEWRLKSWRRAHPEEPAPKQVLLLERFYRIHGPTEPIGWDGPFLVPQARLLIDNGRPGGQKYVLEPFDFSDERFKPMPP